VLEAGDTIEVYVTSVTGGGSAVLAGGAELLD